MGRKKLAVPGPLSDQQSPFATYSLSYSFGTTDRVQVVRSFTVAELFASYGKILWEEGRHKANVKSFLGEINEIFLNARFSTFDQETLDGLIGTLRERGNSNATINRKLAALSKLLRKACKMGDLHSLPEFRRQKERSGRIRFLDFDEEHRLFAAIRAIPNTTIGFPYSSLTPARGWGSDRSEMD